MDISGGCSDTSAQEQQHTKADRQHLDAQQLAKQQVKYILPPIPQPQLGIPSLRRLNRPNLATQRLPLPKQSPLESFVAGASSAMSGYPYSNPYGQPSAYATSAVPQYTQAQIDSYYQQYQCYPPQPYQIIPEYYAPSYVQSGYGQGQDQQYAYQQQLAESQDANKLAPPPDEETLRRRRSKSDRRSRSGSRTRTWTCDIPNCNSTANFTRLADLQRHQSTVHGIGSPEYPCYVPRCTRIGDKGFTRRDHLVEHLRNFHHLDIPKRKPGERSANPLGLPPYPPES